MVVPLAGRERRERLVCAGIGDGVGKGLMIGFCVPHRAVL